MISYWMVVGLSMCLMYGSDEWQVNVGHLHLDPLVNYFTDALSFKLFS